MISRLGVVIYWACLLVALLFSTVAYLQFVEEVGGSNCILSEEDQMGLYSEDLERLYGGDLVGFDFGNMSISGVECLLERKSNQPETVYGEAPFWWLVCFLIALAGYAIKYILTGNKNPLPWRKESSK
jgi:hypothetical protein